MNKNIMKIKGKHHFVFKIVFFMNFAVYLYSWVTMVTMLSEHLQILFKIKVVLYMHLDMIAVNFFRLIQFYDTLLNLLSYI